ncbi:MAG: hypothetical protein WDM89_11280 [Rhizomicrobium sp.]
MSAPGLDNEEISLADAVITIPTSEFSSLNLGQAVLLIGYEWFRTGDDTVPARIEHGPVHRKPTRESCFNCSSISSANCWSAAFCFRRTSSHP